MSQLRCAFRGWFGSALLLTGLSACFPSPAAAETATQAEMTSVCRNWLAITVHREGGWAGDPAPSIRAARDLVADGTVLARCFSIAPRGYVVVPVLKELPPVKVYGEEFDLDLTEAGGIPALLRDVLGKYARIYRETYGSLKAVPPGDAPPLFGPGNRENWDRLTADPAVFAAGLERRGLPVRSQVGPLLTTNWYQRAPYNNFCPVGDSGRTCAVGCLATALAQIMRYHQWPPSGLGSHYYWWLGDDSCGGQTEGGWVMADFSDSYDWANMPDDCEDPPCTDPQENALAELCFEVGASLDMDYGICGSGPMAMEFAPILHNTFRYADTAVMDFRNLYTLGGWFSLLQAEIDAQRPVLYLFQVYANHVGHAVVCDGWSDDGGEYRYHINYGWGGPNSGWWAIDHIPLTYDPMVETIMRNIEPGSGFVFQVRPDGSGTFPTIQQTLNQVIDGDIIELSAGVFSGPGNRDLDFSGKAVTLRSADLDPAFCGIDCGGGPAEHRAFRFHSGEDSTSVVEGITIEGGFVAGLNKGAGILCGTGTSPSIRNCVFRGDSSATDGGAISCAGSSPVIDRCIFDGNAAGRAGGAIHLEQGAAPRISRCTLYDNRAPAPGGAGIHFGGTSAVQVDHTIISSSAGEAVHCEGAAPTPTLACCDINGNAGGDWTGCIAGQLGANGNISEDPRFCDPAGGDFHVQEDSPCGPEVNPGCGLIGGVSVGCRHHLVRPDGTGAFPTIQAAIDAAGESDFVELADGIYRGEGNRDIDFRRSRITVRSMSGVPDSCVIDCQGGPDDPHRAFDFHSGERSSSRLAGIKVVNGYSKLMSGGAVSCTHNSSPAIDNCVFRENRSEGSAGALYCAEQSNPEVTGCGFFGNSAQNGGAVFLYASTPTIRNCTFAENRAEIYASAVSVAFSTATIRNSIMAFNQGRPPVFCSQGGLLLSCCDLYGNEGGDWTGCAAGQEGTDGNISLDPLFCDASVGDYRLAGASPCAPFTMQNPGCDLIGAYPVGCVLTEAGEAFPGPRELFLARGEPNPFRHSTRISYALRPGRTPVRMHVFDPAGRLVRTLVDAEETGGAHELVWDGTDDRGREAPSGIYFCRLQAGTERLARRIVLIRE